MNSDSLLDSSKISSILNADNALELLLVRLKQSILTCDELSRFVKKKLIIGDEHYTQMKKLARSTKEVLKNDQGRYLKNDSFISNFDEIIGFDEKLFNVGTSYVKLLTQMYDQLVSLSSTVARSRKSIKDEARRKEKECVELIQSLEKLKSKYLNLCNEWEKLKNLDPSKKTFTLKGSKTLSQQEEELMKKIESLNSDYKSKCNHCHKLKDELLRIHRPSNLKLLKNLILEIDIALSAQLSKYSTWNETLFLNSGITISPLQNDLKKPSMKEFASNIDNEKDLYNYLIKVGIHQNRALVPVEYQVHPSFKKLTKDKPHTHTPVVTPISIPTPINGLNTAAAVVPTIATATLAPPVPAPVSGAQAPAAAANANDYKSLDPAGTKLTGPRPLSSISDSEDSSVLPPGTTINAKTFGVPISSLCNSEDDLVPDLVTQCISIIEEYGLDLEGIYRTSANASKLKELRESIDSDPLNISKLRPLVANTNILDSDIYCIASLLKTFFSNLPEPLLPNEYYSDLISLVRIPDASERYITLHHIIFKLPDESYWTLRLLILHLLKVALSSGQNKMTPRNLGIVWGPTLMLGTSQEEVAFQGQVVEELILNANNLYKEE